MTNKESLKLLEAKTKSLRAEIKSLEAMVDARVHALRDAEKQTETIKSLIDLAAKKAVK